MNPKTKKILGLVFLVLLSLLAIGSAFGKIMATADSEMGQQFIKIGIYENRFLFAGLEVFCALMLILPRTSTIGVVLSGGYWGGALATDLSHGHFAAPVLVAMLLLGLVAIFRNPELFQRLQGRQI